MVIERPIKTHEAHEENVSAWKCNEISQKYITIARNQDSKKHEGGSEGFLSICDDKLKYKDEIPELIDKGDHPTEKTWKQQLVSMNTSLPEWTTYLLHCCGGLRKSYLDCWRKFFKKALALKNSQLIGNTKMWRQFTKKWAVQYHYGSRNKPAVVAWSCSDFQ